uniref:Putative LOC100166252 [Acyrthosiphon pisum] n=1 Tax=Lepeophtheirus salmonis TaxID=72036 RepID=A0A0K2TIZ0_LEPSM
MNIEEKVKWMQQMFNEVESCSSEDELSNIEEAPLVLSEDDDFVEEDIHIFGYDCNESENQNESDPVQAKRSKLECQRGKDGQTFWYNDDDRSFKIRYLSSNILHFIPGLKGPSLNAKSSCDLWDVFFTPDIIDLIVKHTNSLIAEDRSECIKSPRTNTDAKEIKAVIGLLLLTGTYHSYRLHLNDIWKSDGSGIEIFKLTMPLDRFRFLLSCLRFGEKECQNEQKKHDKLAPIRQVFEKFVDNCKNNYIPTEHMTIDEMLVPFRGSCSFRQYVPSKPARYGVKVHALCDSKTFYVYNMEIYAGLQPEGPVEADMEFNSSKAVVLRLISDISGSGRNITFNDYWYTSILLVKELLENHNITSVGTLRNNKKEIPPEFLNVKNKQNLGSMFGFNGKLTLVPFIQNCKNKKKHVILVSSMHHESNSDLDTDVIKKTEIIYFYNSTKVGVDIVDQMVSNYSSSRSSRRWPLTIFFSLINIASVNSYVLYLHKNEKKLKRRLFIKEVAYELIKDNLLKRLHNVHVPTKIRKRISEILNVDIPSSSPENLTIVSLKRCTLCGRSKDRKVKTRCNSCYDYVCSEHSQTTLKCNICKDIS